MSKKIKKGKFIVFEGIDGSGLSTQAQLLKNYLLGKVGDKTILAKEPSEGPIGMVIRQFLSGRMTGPLGESLALLFAADRLDHNQNKIIPSIEQGNFVICDRYLWSSLAYQGIENDMEWIKEINRYALKPDLTIFIKVRPEVSLKRIAHSRHQTELFEKKETLEKVLANYINIFKHSQDLGENVVEINGENLPEQVAQEVIKAVEENFF
ncbi:MAG: dTMP kinase [Desulfitobacteriia bacterium]